MKFHVLIILKGSICFYFVLYSPSSAGNNKILTHSTIAAWITLLHCHVLANWKKNPMLAYEVEWSFMRIVPTGKHSQHLVPSWNSYFLCWILLNGLQTDAWIRCHPCTAGAAEAAGTCACHSYFLVSSVVHFSTLDLVLLEPLSSVFLCVESSSYYRYPQASLSWVNETHFQHFPKIHFLAITFKALFLQIQLNVNQLWI